MPRHRYNPATGTFSKVGAAAVVPADQPLGRYDCPDCRKVGVLTAQEASKRYHCRECTQRTIGYGFNE